MFLSSVLVGEVVALRQVNEALWQLYFGPILLGLLDAAKPELGVQRVPDDNVEE